MEPPPPPPPPPPRPPSRQSPTHPPSNTNNSSVDEALLDMLKILYIPYRVKQPPVTQPLGEPAHYGIWKGHLMKFHAANMEPNIQDGNEYPNVTRHSLRTLFYQTNKKTRSKSKSSDEPKRLSFLGPQTMNIGILLNGLSKKGINANTILNAVKETDLNADGLIFNNVLSMITDKGEPRAFLDQFDMLSKKNLATKPKFENDAEDFVYNLVQLPHYLNKIRAIKFVKSIVPPTTEDRAQVKDNPIHTVTENLNNIQEVMSALISSDKLRSLLVLIRRIFSHLTRERSNRGKTVADPGDEWDAGRVELNALRQLVDTQSVPIKGETGKNTTLLHYIVAYTESKSLDVMNFASQIKGLNKVTHLKFSKIYTELRRLKTEHDALGQLLGVLNLNTETDIAQANLITLNKVYDDFKNVLQKPPPAGGSTGPTGPPPPPPQPPATGSKGPLPAGRAGVFAEMIAKQKARDERLNLGAGLPPKFESPKSVNLFTLLDTVKDHFCKSAEFLGHVPYNAAGVEAAYMVDNKYTALMNNEPEAMMNIFSQYEKEYQKAKSESQRSRVCFAAEFSDIDKTLIDGCKTPS